METNNTREHCNCKGGIALVEGPLKLVLFLLVLALAAYTYLTIKEAQNVHERESTISVNGEGEVLARPDIATFSFGVRAEADDAATAQTESAEAVNEIMAYLTGEGIEEKDIKTQYYNLNPRYDYVEAACTTGGFCPPGERVLRGYEVNQTIQVKVRDIDTAGELISGVGTRGATNVSSLQFTIDDEDRYVSEAREEAISDAQEKAQELADQLGVRLARVVGFWEGIEGYGGSVMLETRAMAMDAEEGAGAPSIPTGENTFTSRVNITYEIR